MTELLQLLPVIFLGIVSGIAIGMFPGLGPATGILVLYPVLMGLSVVELFIFYSVMMSSVQYYGSIPSIVYGIAGEITSTPAVQYGHAEFRSGRGAELLGSTATSSLIASVVGVLVFYLAAQHTDFMKYFLNNNPRLILLSSIIVLISITSERKILALVFAIIGLTIGQIGYNELRFDYFLSSPTFLTSGIPFVPVFIGFLMLPEILHYARHRSIITNVNVGEFGFRARVKNLLTFPLLMSSLRGSVIGAFSGLIPTVGTSVSSLIAAMVEKKINCNNQKIVVSAEAANNAASITVLIPLIFLALPVIPSEAVIMALAERNGFGISNSFTLMSSMSSTLIVILLAINVVNWVIAGIFYQSMVSMYAKLNTIIYPLLIIISVAVCGYVGIINNQLGQYALLTTMSIFASFFVREFSVRLALVFGMFLSTSLSSEIFRFILFNF